MRTKRSLTSNKETHRALVLAAFTVLFAAMVAAQIPRQPTPGGADYYEIMDLNARFCHSLDSGGDQGRMFAKLFIPNGAYVDASGEETRGSESLAGLARSYGKPDVTNVRHFTINVWIEMVPGGARQWSYLLIAGPGPAGSPGMVTEGGQYWDKLVKTPEGWRFQKRTLLKPGTPRPEASAFFAGLSSGAQVDRKAKPAASSELTPLDRAQIYQLYAHYPYALDKALDNGEAFASLFTANGVMVDSDGSSIAGRDKLAEFVWRRGLTDDNTYIANVMLDPPTPEGVIAQAYVMNSHIPQLPGSSTIYPVGMFVDHIVKTPEGWRFQQKVLVAPGVRRAAASAGIPLKRPVVKTTEVKAVVHQNQGGALTADDYADIQQLYARYAHGYDSKVDNGVVYLSVYSKTGRFTDQFNRIVDGFDALDKTYAHSATGAPNPIGITHSTWNILVDPAPWGAVGRSYTGGGRINAAGAFPSPGLLGEYLDMIVKTPDGWRFERRIFRQHFPRPPGRVGGPPSTNTAAPQGSR